MAHKSQVLVFGLVFVLQKQAQASGLEHTLPAMKMRLCQSQGLSYFLVKVCNSLTI